MAEYIDFSKKYWMSLASLEEIVFDKSGLCRCDQVQEVERLFWIFLVVSVSSQGHRGSPLEKVIGWRRQIRLMCFETGGRHQTPRTTGSPWWLKKARKQMLLLELPERTSPASTLTLTQWNWCWTSDFQNYTKINMCSSMPLSVW